MKRTIAVILLSLLFSATVSAATYYVDVTLGNDTRDGLSQANAWKTLAKVNASAFLAPGDSVLFKCGETWRETLVVPASGAAGNPITFSKYGNCTGGNNPQFKGSEVLSGWTSGAGNIYSANAALIRQPRSYIVNGGFDIDTSNWYYRNDSASPDCSPNPPGCIEWKANVLEGQSWRCSGTSGGCIAFQAQNIDSWVTPTNNDRYYWNDPAYATPPGTYQLEFKLRASDSQGSFQVNVGGRKLGPLTQKNIPASPTWQGYTTDPFTLSETDNLFINFRYYRSATDYPTTYYLDDVLLVPVSGTTQHDPVRQVFVAGNFVKVAQHPNPSPTDPTDTYLSIASDSAGCPSSGAAGVTSFAAGDLNNANEADLVGAGIHIRINDFYIDDRTITDYNPATKTVTLDTLTRFNLCKDWGFYFDNKRWMLDQPGEWHYDNNAQQLSLRLPDDGAPNPASPVEAAHRDYGIDARARAYLIFDGIDLLQFQNGADLSYSSNVTIQNSTVSNSGVNGIVANNAVSPKIQYCNIQSTVRDGIEAISSANLSILNNTVNNLGTVGSPKDNDAAIEFRLSSGIADGNHVTNSGYIGIAGGKDSTVSHNRVEDSCRVLNDCGALYTSWYSVGPANPPNPINTVYSDNIVRRVTGNPHGRPAGADPNVRGIYLDGGSSYVTVTHNTVTNSSGQGLTIIGGLSDHNTITGNTIYGTTQQPVALGNGYGTLPNSTHDNQVLNNTLFPSQVPNNLRAHDDYAFLAESGAPYLVQEANIFLVDQSASPNSPCFNCSFDNNRYSSLYTRVAIQQVIGDIPTHYPLPQWQQPPQSQDLNSTTFNPFSIARYRLTGALGTNFVTNSTFNNNDASGWGQSNGTLFAPTDCVTGGCLGYTYTTDVYGSVGSNGFDVAKDQYYLVHFDLRALNNNQRVEVVLRNDSQGIGFDAFFTTNTSWESYSYVIKANEDASSTAPGGRASLAFYLYDLNAGIELDNVRVQPITAPAVAFNDPSGDSAILINDTPAPKAIACPDTAKCNAYVYFSNGTPVTWPVTVPAMSSQIVVWTASPFKDTDHDGIVDTQDTCPGTNADTPVTENGCSFIQQYPPSSCMTSNPITQVTSLGSGSGATNEEVKVTFIGNITNASAFATKPATYVLYLCPETTVRYSATATRGQLVCRINNNVARPSGTLRINDNLLCTNRPGGGDTDKFFVK